MRCALHSIEVLKEYYEFDFSGLYKALEMQMDEKGISIHTLITTSMDYQLNLQARKGWRLPKQCPCILFYRPLYRGHFNVLLKNELFYIVIKEYDEQEKRIFKPWFYLFFSHIYIVCYNVKKEV